MHWIIYRIHIISTHHTHTHTPPLTLTPSAQTTYDTKLNPAPDSPRPDAILPPSCLSPVSHRRRQASPHVSRSLFAVHRERTLPLSQPSLTAQEPVHRLGYKTSNRARKQHKRVTWSPAFCGQVKRPGHCRDSWEAGRCHASNRASVCVCTCVFARATSGKQSSAPKVRVQTT
ncbi:hypothetical protein V8C40DRAFT_118585 [Trichoderma camerunense]